MNQIDERDIIFARMAYIEGTPEYKDYYSRNPHLELPDAELRNMQHLCSPNSPTFNPYIAPLIEAGFELISRFKPNAKVAADKVDVPTAILKKLLKDLGAKNVGIAKMQPNFYYSHRGRKGINYGQPITENFPFAIAFTIEMAEDLINCAPQSEELVAVVKGYMDATTIGVWIANYINRLGYQATPHFDANYLVYAPLVAEAAGLGEIGLHGLLVTENEGSRVRLGVITTDLPLSPDTKYEFGLQQFCLECGRCAARCPAKAIKANAKFSASACYKMWRKLGTDCGICIKSCPLSHTYAKKFIGKLKNKEQRQALLALK